MRALARVAALAGEHALVEVLDGEGRGCGRCHEPGGCGGSLLSKALPGSRTTYAVANTLRATVGNTVVLTIPEGAGAHASLHGYLIPLALIILGTFVASIVAPNDPYLPVLGFIAGILAGGAYLSRFGDRRRDARFLEVKLDSIVQLEHTCSSTARLPH